MKTKHIKTKTLLVAAGLLSCTALAAQNRHEISVSGGGGISTLKYESSISSPKIKFGGNSGINYHYFFTKEWGIGTGLEVACYNAKYTTNMMFKYDAIDNNGNDFEFNSKIDNYSEQQNAVMLQIPLMLQYQVGKGNKFYFTFGGKVGIPLHKQYKSSGTVQNTGSYESPVKQIVDLGTFNIDDKGTFGLKAAFFASAEAGTKWDLGKKMALYTGIYLDYGVNNIYSKPAVDVPLVEYNADSPNDLTLNSVLNSQYPQSVSSAFVDKIHPLAAGLKVRLSLGFKGAEQEKKPKEPKISNAEAQRMVAETAENAQQELAAAKAETAKAEAARLAAEAKLEAAETARLAAEKALTEEVNKQTAEKKQAAKMEIQKPVSNYDLSKTELTDKQKQELDKKIALLQQYSDFEIFIYGHTCNTGGDAINEKVGLQRAENVKKYLISKGIDQKRIVGIASKRDTEPLVPNTSEENRKQNRRVEIIISNE